MRIISRSIVNKTCTKFKCNKYKSSFYNFFHKQRGIVQESKAIRAYQFKKKSQVTRQQDCVEIDRPTYKIVGKIDGICNNHVIEIKCRSSKIKIIPKWEIDQLSLYCFALQMPGLLVEYNNGILTSTEYSLEFVNERVVTLLELLQAKISEIQNLVAVLKK